MMPEEIKKYEQACAAIMKDCLTDIYSPDTLERLRVIMNYADILQSETAGLKQENERLKERVALLENHNRATHDKLQQQFNQGVKDYERIKALEEFIECKDRSDKRNFTDSDFDQ